MLTISACLHTTSFAHIKPAVTSHSQASIPLLSSLYRLVLSISLLSTYRPIRHQYSLATVKLARSVALLNFFRRQIPGLPTLKDRLSKSTPAWINKDEAGSGRREGMTSTPDPRNTAVSSTLSGITAFSPWGSRSATPKPGGDGSADVTESGLGTQRGGDHTVSHRHRLSLRDYPRDCPRFAVQWYHAVDVRRR
jgi:hypothetical protein